MTKIVIIGGGVIGSATAYHLAMAGAAGDTVVVEPDPTYEHAATPRSTGGVRVLFSLPENIRMALYGHEIYGGFERLMAVDGESVDLGLVRRGYLFLCQGSEDGETLEANWAIQTAEGANVLLLDPGEVQARYPSLEVQDVDLAVLSPDDAIIDPHAALMGFRRKARSLGVTYLEDRAVGLQRRARRIDSVTLASSRRLDADWVINAANCWAPEICDMVGMPLPVAPMRRMNFYFECRAQFEQFPLVRHFRIAGGFRPEGRGYLTGITHYDEPRGFNWEVDYSVFEEELWPLLARRVKAFEAVKLRRAWACHYDQNALDANLIIGPWSGEIDNFLIACGLSGHGLMQAPAIGRALKELIVDGGYQTLDLSRFGYQRVVDNQPLLDRGPLS